MTRAREAMVPDPPALSGDATVQEAGRLLARPDVRAVLVVTAEGRLVGQVTSDSIVARVVAEGRDPVTTIAADAVEPAPRGIDAAMSLEEAFAQLEELDLERAPVLAGDKLVGVISRSVLQRRLAEDSSPADPDDAASAL